MKKSQLLGAVCAGVVTLLASVSANASIVYNLNRTIGAGTVTGFIETDETIGVLTSANITNWSLTLTAPNLQWDSPSIIDYSPTQYTYLTGIAVSASATALTFDFDAPGSNTMILMSLPPANDYYNGYCISVGTGCLNMSSPGEAIFRDASTANTVAAQATRTGTVDFAVASVPVPAAVWLFSSGLLGLVGMARCKKIV